MSVAWGAGERATVTAAPAIANAIFWAAGARVLDWPLTPARLGLTTIAYARAAHCPEQIGTVYDCDQSAVGTGNWQDGASGLEHSLLGFGRVIRGWATWTLAAYTPLTLACFGTRNRNETVGLAMEVLVCATFIVGSALVAFAASRRSDLDDGKYS